MPLPAGPSRLRAAIKSVIPKSATHGPHDLSSSPVPSSPPGSPGGHASAGTPLDSPASRPSLGNRSPNSRSLSPDGPRSPVSIVDTFHPNGHCIPLRPSGIDIVYRAFLLAKKTGAVVIGKQGLELGDDSVAMVVNELEKRQDALHTEGPAIGRGMFGKIVGLANQQVPITSFSLCNHGVGRAGAAALAAAFKENVHLEHLNLNHNDIGADGAAALCRELVTVKNLRSLNLGNNSIGPDFPEDLVRCTKLTHLHLQHNLLENISTELGNHPNLEQLELTGNNKLMMPNADHIFQEKCQQKAQFKSVSSTQTFRSHTRVWPPVVQTEIPRKAAGEKSVSNLSTTELRKCLLDVKVDLCAREHYRNVGELDESIPRISEVAITLVGRWNKLDWEPNFICQLLSTHTSLQSLNGLQDWPTPPLAPSTTWNLTASIKNPLYECVFVKNRLSSPSNMMELVLDKNDLRGRAAKDIADGLLSLHCLQRFSAMECKWDGSIDHLAAAVHTCSQLHTVNGKTLRDSDLSWDLKGCIENEVDTSFVVRMLSEKGPLGNLTSLDLRDNQLLRRNAVRLAEAIRAVRDLEMLNGLFLPESVGSNPGEDATFAQKQMDFVPATQEAKVGRSAQAPEGEFELGSRMSVLSSRDSPVSPVRLTESLELRKQLLDGRVENGSVVATWGTAPVELTFFACLARRRPLLVDINLSDNLLGDVNAPYVVNLMMELTGVLEQLHLTNNSFTEECAEEMGAALAQMRVIKLLRLSNNPLGTRGLQHILEGLAVRHTITALHLDRTGLGPFIPKPLYRLDQLDFLAIKHNSVIGLPTDLLKLEKLSTLWFDGNPIEFPPPPIADTGFKKLMAWLRQSKEACAEIVQDGGGHTAMRPVFERARSGSDVFSRAGSSQRCSLTESTLMAARLDRSSSFSQNVPSQRNKLWLKIARSRVVGREHDINEQEEDNKTRLQCRLFRHGQKVHDLSFHAQLPIFATCSEDRTVKDLVNDDIWTCSHTLKGHADSVTHLTFAETSNQLMLASVSRDNLIRLWIPEKDPFGDNEIWTCGQVLARQRSEAHKGSVNALSFSPVAVRLMLASGAEDNCIKIWGVSRSAPGDESDDQNRKMIIPIDDQRLDTIRHTFESFSRGEIPDQIYNEDEKRLAGRGKRALSMDMKEFMEFARWSGLAECVSKTILSSTFRAVNEHGQSDEDRHEFTFTEFCELLFRVSKKAQGTAGKTFTVKHITWNRFGMISHIQDTDVDLLNRYGDNAGLLEVGPGEMGWACLFTIEAHLGTVTSLTWLPIQDPVVVSTGMDDRIKLWAFTENSRGRGQWTNTNNVRAHEALVHGLTFVNDRSQGEDRIVGVSSAADNTVAMWTINAILQVRGTLDGQEVSTQYLLKRGQKIEVPDGTNIFCTALRRDAKLLAAGCDDGAVLLWTNVGEDAWQLAERFQSHDGIINCIRFGGHGCVEACFTVSEDGKCCVLDTSDLVGASHHYRGLNECKPVLERLSVSASKLPLRKSILPPRSEARMYDVRHIPPWSAEVEPDNMERLERRLLHPTRTKSIEMVPHLTSHLVLRCQEMSPTYRMEMVIDVKTVWYRIEASVDALNPDAIDLCLFTGLDIVSPIVQFSPSNFSFRKPITIKLPHHSSLIDNLELLQCVDAAPKITNRHEGRSRLPAVWEPIPCAVSGTHVTAEVDRIRGPMVVVYKSDKTVVHHQVYAIALGSDGKPTAVNGDRGLHLEIGQPWQGQIELIPASSVQLLTALNSGYLDQWPLMSRHSLAKGACISEIVTHVQSLDSSFEARAASLGSLTWEGVHLVLGMELLVLKRHDLLAVSRPASREEGRPRSRSWQKPKKDNLHRGAAVSMGRSRTDLGKTLIRPASQQCPDPAAVFAFALHDVSGQELIRLDGIRVVPKIPVFNIWARWGDTTDTCMLEIQLPSGSPLSELREQALLELSSPRGRQSPLFVKQPPSCRTTKSSDPLGFPDPIDDYGMNRPRTSSPGARARTPLGHKERPHTSAGLAAVPADRLHDLHFTGGGTRFSNGDHRASRVTRSALTSSIERSTPPKSQLEGQSLCRPRSGSVRKAKSGANLVPREYEALLPAAAICSRGYALLLARPGKPEQVGASVHGYLRAEGHRIHVAQDS